MGALAHPCGNLRPRFPVDYFHAGQKAQDPRSLLPFRSRRRRAPARRNDEGTLPLRFAPGPTPMGDGGPVLPGLVGVRRGLRRAGGAQAHLGGSLEHALGRGAFVERRFRQDLGASRSAPRALPRDLGRRLEEHLADRARPRLGARHAVLRRRAVRALRVARRRKDVVAEPGPLGSSASREMDAGRRRPLPPHDPGRSIERRAPHRRDLDGRRLPLRRRRKDLAAAQPRRARRVLSRSAPGVRPVRPQDRAPPRPSGTALPPEPLGSLPVGRRGRHLEGRGQRRPVRLRLLHGHPPAGSRTRPTSCHCTPTVSAALPTAACACTARATPARRGSR